MSNLNYQQRAEEIAALMRGHIEHQFSDSPQPNRLRLLLPETGVPNAKLSLAFSPYNAKGRLVVTCLFPNCPDYGPVNANTFVSARDLEAVNYTSSISMAESKSADQMVRDIERRLLRGYLQALAATNEGIAERVKEIHKKSQLIKRLADIAGQHLSEEQVKRERIHVYDGSRSMDIDLSGEKVRVEMRWISPELAEKVILLFNENA